MTEQYPSNSHQSKKVAAPKTEEERTKLPPVAKAVVVKKPLGKRFKETFFGGDDAKGVISHVFQDVLKPAFRDTLMDAGQEALQRAIYPNGGGPRNNINGIVRNNLIGQAGASLINYQGMTKTPSSVLGGMRPDPRQPAVLPPPVGSVDPRQIGFNSRVEAQTVLDELILQVAQYNQATVADLYDLCQMETDFTFNKWGWTDLSAARVGPHRGQTVLFLPPTEQLAA